MQLCACWVQLSSVGGGDAGVADGVVVGFGDAAVGFGAGVGEGFDGDDVEGERGNSSSVVLVDGSAVEACSEC
jgi:hypothetical protein